MRATLIIAFACSVSCAHPPRTPASDRSVLTREEIASATGAASLYDVIRRLRAEYLTDRGRTSLVHQGDTRPVVFMNAQELGPIESLRTIEPDAVEEVRFFSATSAVSRFGSRYGTGVIQVRPRQP